MATATTPLKSVFLSHSSADASLAAQLSASLEAQGLSCWLAPRDVIPGRPYAEECVRGIEQSAAFILLASAAAISSVQVLSEVEQAHKRNKPLYTIMVGKPKVTKELDYYISRLHWIEYGGDSVEALATRLATVLNGAKDWTEVASPPSLRRTVLYRRDAFVGSAMATAVVLLVAGLGLYYWTNRSLNLDYRRLGYVTVAAEPTGNDSAVHVQARVWLLAERVPFRDVTFRTVAEGSNAADRQDHSSAFTPDRVGSQELVRFPIPGDANRLTTCLSVPSPGLHARYRVTQTFSVSPDHAMSPTSDPVVTKDDNTPCGKTL